MVVDSSALIAILLNEAEKADFSEAILAADSPQIAAPNFFEASMVAETRQGVAGCRDLDRLSASLGLAVVAFDATHIEGARDAYRRYGKGRHRAALNFGDCCAYALAKALDWPLLFKGNDFALTDLKRAV
ncbi:MAG: type II toxin-antitoxin system VapC family toxin [Rhodospirillales bacterium]|nr:type II toxin-antitoxin system VapC family toxin [Rhodospirillales bacterium]